MFTKIVAAGLSLFFLAFVNLAAAVTASLNRAETSVIASLAGLFQALVDVGVVIAISFLLIRAIVKFAQQADAANRRAPARKSAYRSAYEPVQMASQMTWHNPSQQPLPFDNHLPAAFDQLSEQQPQMMNTTPPQGVLTQNIHWMRQQRGGYRMTR